MTSEGTAPRTNYVSFATGFCLVALGILLLMQRSGLIELRQVVQLWPVALILIGGAVAAQAIRGGDAFRGVPVGSLVWVVLLGALFSVAYDRRATGADAPGGQVSLFALMSGDRRSGPNGAFHGGQITAVMGGAELDLRKSVVAAGETVVVDIFTVMGGAVIRVPASWRVDVETFAVMGGAKDQRPRWTDGPAGQAGERPRLVLRGTAVMGGITVKQ